MTKLIFDFEQVLKSLFKINNQLDKLELKIKKNIYIIYNLYKLKTVSIR